MVKILATAWNAQGAGVSGSSGLTGIGNTWDILLDTYVRPFYKRSTPLADLFLGLIVEAGRPPGIDTRTLGHLEGEYKSNSLYSHYYWTAWNQDRTDANLRCSLAAMQCHITERLRGGRFSFSDSPFPRHTETWIRPILYSSIYFEQKKGFFYICLVHLPSGAWRYAKNIELLASLIKQLLSYSDCIGFSIVGDMNINLQSPAHDAATVLYDINCHFDKKIGIKIVRTGHPTQRSEKGKYPELDWGIAYGCEMVAKLLGPLHGTLGAGKGFREVAIGISDHAVLGYEIDLDL